MTLGLSAQLRRVLRGPGTLARALGRRFAGTFALAFVVVHAALALLTLLVVRLEAPALPAAELLALVVDAWIVALPLTFTAIAAGAAMGVVREACRQRLLLGTALMGQPPWRACWLLLAFAGAGSLALWPVIAYAVPEANYHLRFPIASTDTGVQALLSAAAAGGVGQGGMYWRGRAAGDHELTEVQLASQQAGTAALIVADRVRTAPWPPDSLEFRFERGRLLQQQDRRLELNASFAELALRVDGRDLARPGKHRLLPLTYYRDDELPAFAAQAALCGAHGVQLTPAMLCRATATAAAVVRALRCASALQPLLAVAVVVLLLARPRATTPSLLLGAATAILLGVAVQIGLEARATRSADLPGPWLAALPAATTIAAALLLETWQRRGVRHAR